jgi:hypothetical protein
LKKTIFNTVKSFAIIFLLAYSYHFELQAQIAPVYSNDYLNIGIDAAGLSRGNSVVATISGVNAGYWNPAGIVNMATPFEISFMHANYFSGMANYDYAGFAYKYSDSMAMGFSLIRFGVDDIPNTLNLIDENGNVNYNRISYFSVADYAFLFSLSRKSRLPGFDYGANLKIVYRKQGKFASAYGFGFDIGAQYALNKWKFGAVLRDASSTYNFWIFRKELFEEIYLATGNQMPQNSIEITLPKLLLGVSRYFNLTEKFSLLMEIDLDWHFDGARHALISSDFLNIDPHFGFELGYSKSIFFRAGINHFQWIEDFDKMKKMNASASIGLGFYFKGVSLDYALTDIGDMGISPLSHIFSVKYSFGKFLK